MDDATKNPFGQVPVNPPKPLGSTPPNGADLKFAAGMGTEQKTAPVSPPIPVPQRVPVPVPPQASTMPTTTPVPQAKQPQPASSQQGFTSSIRTMADDIAKLKVGQKPSGESFQKTVSSEAPVVVQPIQQPTKQPISSRTQLELGGTERTSPMNAPLTKTSIAPLPTTSTAPKTNLGNTLPSQRFSAPTSPISPLPPAQSGSNIQRIALVIGILLIIGGLGYGVYLFSTRNSEVAEVTPTPSQGSLPSTTPTPSAALTLTSIFGPANEEIELANSATPVQEFRTRMNAVVLQLQEFKRLAVRTATKGTELFSARDFLDRLLISYPPALRPLIGEDSALLVYGQRETFSSKGVSSMLTAPDKRLVLVFEIKDVAMVRSTLQQWEPDMARTLIGLFDSNPVKGKGILDNIHNEIAIRYQNFSWPNTSIDYSIVPSKKTGATYLVIAGSREAMFATIDKLQ
jgi:hypothetical protein